MRHRTNVRSAEWIDTAFRIVRKWGGNTVRHCNPSIAARGILGGRNYPPSMPLYRLAPAQRQGQYGAFYGISNGLMSAAPLVLGAAIALGDGWGWWGLSVATVALALLI